MSFTKEQLLPGERLILLARQHKLVLAQPAILVVIVIAILAVITYFSDKIWLLAFCAIPLINFLWRILVWRKEEYILTDRRVVKQQGVLSTSSFDAPLDKINNVFHRQTLMGRIFKYGDVGLETASEQGTTVFNFLPRPVEFKNQLVHQRELCLSGSGPVPASRPDIPKMLEELASLRDRNIITGSEFEEKKRALLEKM
jgi:uncharacterized membrane protein YdbT with pleckstrin-like domain